MTAIIWIYFIKSKKIRAVWHYFGLFNLFQWKKMKHVSFFFSLNIFMSNEWITGAWKSGKSPQNSRKKIRQTTPNIGRMSPKFGSDELFSVLSDFSQIPKIVGWVLGFQYTHSEKREWRQPKKNCPKSTICEKRLGEGTLSIVQWFWHDSGMVLAWIWHGSGMVLAWFWHGSGRLLACF